MHVNFPSILHEFFFIFLFYTSIFSKHPHQSIYSTHLFNKIFILLQYLLFSHSLPLSLSQTQPPSSSSSSLDHSTPSHHHHPPNQHHQGKPSHSSRNPLNLKLTQSKIHSIRKPNHHPPNPKPTDQTTRNQWQATISNLIRLCVGLMS